MKRLWVLLCAVLFGLGCSSDGQKGQWDEFWKDLRGDNMKMSTNFPGDEGASGPAKMKAGD